MEKTDTFNLAFKCDCGAGKGYDLRGIRYCTKGHILEKIEGAEPLSPAEYRELSA